jgi:hypothetical protein
MPSTYRDVAEKLHPDVNPYDPHLQTRITAPGREICEADMGADHDRCGICQTR